MLNEIYLILKVYYTTKIPKKKKKLYSFKENDKTKYMVSFVLASLKRNEVHTILKFILPEIFKIIFVELRSSAQFFLLPLNLTYLAVFTSL